MFFEILLMSYSDGNLEQILDLMFCCKVLHPFKGKRLFLTNPGRGMLAMKFLSLLSCCTSHVLLKRSTPTEHAFLQFSGLSSCFSCGCRSLSYYQ